MTENNSALPETPVAENVTPETEPGETPPVNAEEPAENPLETQEDLDRFLAEHQQKNVQETASGNQPDDDARFENTAAEDTINTDEPVPEVMDSRTFTPTRQLFSQKSTKHRHRVEQLMQQMNTSPLPQGALYQPDGRSIYTMTDHQINEYLTTLKDAGRTFEAGRVEKARQEYFDRETRIHHELQQLTAEQRQLATLENAAEWEEVEEEYLKQMPGLRQFLPQVSAFIDGQLQTNPAYAAAADSKIGKFQKVYEALQQLGILSFMKTHTSKTQIQSPSAPDAQAGRKKVLTTITPESFTREQIEKMSLDEYVQHEAAIDKALAEGRIV